MKNSVNLLYYKCHRKDIKCGGSCMESSDQIEKEKINKSESIRKSKMINDKCFQYAASIALNYEEIK